VKIRPDEGAHERSRTSDDMFRTPVACAGIGAGEYCSAAFCRILKDPGVMNTSTQQLRIMVADDHPVMREGLRLMIDQQPDMRVVAEARDGAEAIAQFRLHQPDAILMDLRMPHMDGLAAIRILHDISPTARIVVLTTYPGDARVSHALSMGATSYLLKTATSAEIISALRGAAGGHITLGPDVMRDVREWKGAESLSEREIHVLRLVAIGKQNRVIGEELHISEDTVKTRLKNILGKLDARDRTHAVTIALRRGFINSP
jgi:DNA-binding NarL/FixJ family response regulator